MPFEEVFSFLVQNARVVCANMPSRIFKIEAFAIDSFIYVSCYAQN